jgi:hypothetical protein
MYCTGIESATSSVVGEYTTTPIDRQKNIKVMDDVSCGVRDKIKE